MEGSNLRKGIKTLSLAQMSQLILLYSLSRLTERERDIIGSGRLKPNKASHCRKYPASFPNFFTFFWLHFMKVPFLSFSVSVILYSTEFVATASTSNPGMVTHPSANRVPSGLTSVFLWELVLPSLYSLLKC